MIKVHINCVKMKQVTLVFIASCLAAAYGLPFSGSNSGSGSDNFPGSGSGFGFPSGSSSMRYGSGSGSDFFPSGSGSGFDDPSGSGSEVQARSDGQPPGDDAAPAPAEVKV